ncbi:hypothetical protein EBZ39_02780 [bacterium]|nr:hypothetical protein [bacterium]
MSVRNQNWYNLQSTRRYPLDELCTGADDNGDMIRDDIIVDCNVQFPDTYGHYLYVQSISVSAGLVTILLGAANDLNARDGITVCAVSAPKPVTANINYAVTPIVSGVAGWLVLGPGIDTNFTARYATPIQSLISARCARANRALPITTLGKLGNSSSLQGVINIAASSPVAIDYVGANTLALFDGGTAVGQTGQTLIFRLDQALITNTYNPLAEFVGPCGQRPESGTCPKPPIETINGLAPDCAGNVELTFPGFFPQKIVGCIDGAPERCCGLDVLSDLSLSESCLPTVTPPSKDFCCTPASGVQTDEYCWSDPAPAIDVVIDEPISFNYSCASLPVCVDFNGCSIPETFLIATGFFTPESVVAPALCSGSATDNTNHLTAAAAGNSLNIALFKNCATDWAINRRIGAQVNISSRGIDRAAGIVINYGQTKTTFALQTTYVAVVLDVNRGRVRVLRYTGSSFVEEHYVEFSGQINKWYEIFAAPTDTGTGVVALNYGIRDLASGATATGSVVLNNYGEPIGQSGLFSRQTYAYFNNFSIG